MRAVKLKAHVTRDHTLRLDLPEDLGEGPAEVIVLIEESSEPASEDCQVGTLDDFLASSRGARRLLHSKEQIDDYLARERASWE